MNKEIIEKQLHTWFSLMTKKYSWLRIKFEFNEARRVFMVSFSPVDRIELSDEFNLDAMQFSDEMNAIYGNEAPLFTDEESLFKLSDNAEVIEAIVAKSTNFFSNTIITIQPLSNGCSWSMTTSPHTKAYTDKSFHQTEPTYAIAA